MVAILDIKIDETGHLWSSKFNCLNCNEQIMLDQFIAPDVLVGLRTHLCIKCRYCGQRDIVDINSINYLFDRGKHLTRDDWW